MKLPDMKEFKPTSWSIDNKTTIYLLTIVIMLFGYSAYNRLQKERFPEIIIPTIYVGTIYPGTSPADMENLVTRPIEKEIKSISGVKKVTSTSVQDYSAIAVEFNTGIKVTDAKQKVKDALDKARKDLPTDLPTEPNVMEINFSDFPVMFVNLAGNYSLEKIKKYADVLQDKIEEMKEITRVDIVGALNKEVKIDVDLYKLQAAKLTFNDIINAIRYENMTISGGNVPIGGMQRSIRVIGQYTDASKLGDLIIRNGSGGQIPLREVANVDNAYKKRESYARLDNKAVITLNIVKRSGENLVEASDKVRAIVDDLKKSTFPSDLRVVITGDQSSMTRNTLDDLVNTIIIGFILVTFILMFFMGTTNAIFVALSVPISSFLAFIVLQGMGVTLNMIVLFSFLLALGIVVDDAIVVIENTHRIYNQGKLNIFPEIK